MQCKQGAVRTVAMAVAFATSALLGAAAAVAGGKDVLASGGGPDFSANATYTTDYRFRGFTQTREKSALQGGLDVMWPNFYAGIWASSVDFGRVFDGGIFHDTADVELVSYAGMRRSVLGYNLDLRAIYYAYPGAYGVPERLDYFEAMVGFSREIMPQLTLGSKVYFSPDYQGETGKNWVLESTVTRKLGAIGAISPALSATLGSSFGDESKGGIDYSYWNAGFSFVFANYFEFDLRYYDTFSVPESALTSGSCRNLCDGRVVARITFEN